MSLNGCVMLLLKHPKAFFKQKIFKNTIISMVRRKALELKHNSEILAKGAEVQCGMNAEIFPFDFLHPKTPRHFISVVAKAGLWLEKYAFLKYLAGSLLIRGEKC